MPRLSLLVRGALVALLLFLAGGFAAAAAGDKPAATLAPAPLMDINSATAAELMSLPGIGEAYSKKIVENRPYRAKDDLVKRNLIPQATYDKIKDLVIAKQKK